VDSKPSDVIDTIIDDLNREMPGLDPSGMAIAGRLVVVAAKIQSKVNQILKEHGLAQWEFDVLATLRRAGAPFHRSPTSLSRSTLLSTAAMVNRIDRLESRGLVRRLLNPTDRRGIIVELTDEGKALVERVMPERLEEANRVANALSKKDRQVFESLLRSISAAVDQDNL